MEEAKVPVLILEQGPGLWVVQEFLSRGEIAKERKTSVAQWTVFSGDETKEATLFALSAAKDKGIQGG